MWLVSSALDCAETTAEERARIGDLPGMACRQDDRNIVINGKMYRAGYAKTIDAARVIDAYLAAHPTTNEAATPCSA